MFTKEQLAASKRYAKRRDLILSRLERRDANYQARWDRVWESPLCQPYKRPEHEDWWVWNYAFYNAPIPDLQRIAALVGAKRR